MTHQANSDKISESDRQRRTVTTQSDSVPAVPGFLFLFNHVSSRAHIFLPTVSKIFKYQRGPERRLTGDRAGVRGPQNVQKRLSRAHAEVPEHKSTRKRSWPQRARPLANTAARPPLPLSHSSLAMLGKECPALPILDSKCPDVDSFPCSMRISGARATRCMRKKCRPCPRRTTTYPQF